MMFVFEDKDRFEKGNFQEISLFLEEQMAKLAYFEDAFKTSPEFGIGHSVLHYSGRVDALKLRLEELRQIPLL